MLATESTEDGDSDNDGDDGDDVPVIETTTLKNLYVELSEKSRSELSINVEINSMSAREIQYQMYNPTSKKYKTVLTKTITPNAISEVALVFPNTWWESEVTYWKIFMPSIAGFSMYESPTITLKTIRYYQNPSKYVQIKNSIPALKGSGYTLYKGCMGLRVLKVNQYFKIGDRNWPRYSDLTILKVKKFQKRRKLRQTGKVDLKTWLKMGFTRSQWYGLDSYVSKTLVNPSSTRKDHIETLIIRALEYRGTKYTVGASGAKKNRC